MKSKLDIAENLQTWLLNGAVDGDFAPGELIQTHFAEPLTMAQYRLAVRISKGVRSCIQGQASVLDLAVLFRQGIYAFGRRFWITSALWDPLSRLDHRAGIYASAKTRDHVELSVQAWTPNWLPQAGSIGTLETRKFYPTAPATGTLKKAYGFSTYQSEAQKAAVEACEFAAPGSTTLVTLPTGGGKSLCTILPAWRRSAGGTKRGGTTIVVVPTVALAIDQYASALRYFPATQGQDLKPQLWTGSTNEDQREKIRGGVESGTIPLVFTSPESLLQSSLSSSVTTSAIRGNLRSIVIDEAHIVATWGAQFRVDFQLLGAFVRQLNVDSNNELCTILLSATIDYVSEEILRQLFSYGTYTVVRANAVRPEPEWWFSWSNDDFTRRARVVDALAHLPRPAILYVSAREDANRWVTDLRTTGYKRVEIFTGETRDADRELLLQRWRDDEIDIMVATSAFGLGVDKPDVRTILHACLPETVDRFYQEVGRGGRDGQNCISLVCATLQDIDVAVNLTKSSRISTAKAVDRWRGMRQRAKISPDDSSLLIIDLDAPPPYAMGMFPGERHRDWNMHTLLMLQRARLLELVSVPKREIEGKEPEAAAEFHSIMVRVGSTETMHGSYDDLFARLDPFRQRERDIVSLQVRQVAEIVKSRSGPGTEPTECISSVMAGLYPDCAQSCGGCPECRRIGRLPFAEPLQFFVEGAGDAQFPGLEAVNGAIAELMGSRSRLTVLKPERSSQLLEVLGALVKGGIVQFIVPDEYLRAASWVEDLMDEMSQYADELHLVVPEKWLRSRYDLDLRSVPTAILYPDDESYADSLYRKFIERWPSHVPRVPMVSLVREGTFLPSESGRFVDRVPGIVIRGDMLISEMANKSEGWL